MSKHVKNLKNIILISPEKIFQRFPITQQTSHNSKATLFCSVRFPQSFSRFPKWVNASVTDFVFFFCSFPLHLYIQTVFMDSNQLFRPLKKWKKKINQKAAIFLKGVGLLMILIHCMMELAVLSSMQGLIVRKMADLIIITWNIDGSQLLVTFHGKLISSLVMFYVYIYIYNVYCIYFVCTGLMVKISWKIWEVSK